MHKSKQDKLYEDFPRLYSQATLGKSKSCMHWGVAVDDGWFAIIYNLSEQLEKIFQAIPSESKPEDPYKYTFFQIKEKFGCLRIYLSEFTPEMNSLIQEAEKESSKICEKCGKPGIKTRSHAFWTKTLCKDHTPEEYRKDHDV